MIGTDVLTYDCKDVLYPRPTLRKAAPAGWIRFCGCFRRRHKTAASAGSRCSRSWPHHAVNRTSLADDGPAGSEQPILHRGRSDADQKAARDHCQSSRSYSDPDERGCDIKLYDRRKPPEHPSRLRSGVCPLVPACVSVRPARSPS